MLSIRSVLPATMKGTTMFGLKKRIKPEVKWGAAVLDQAIPGWYNHIDLGQLDMMSMTRCILGQLGTHPQVQKHAKLRWGAWALSPTFQFINAQDYIRRESGELVDIYNACLHPAGRRSWINAIKERRAVDAEQAKCRELRDLKIVEVEYDLAA